MRADAEDEILAGEARDLGHAEPRLDRDEEERVIAPTTPGALIRRGEQGLDFARVRNGTSGRVNRLVGMASTRWIWAAWVGASNAAYRKKE